MRRLVPCVVALTAMTALRAQAAPSPIDAAAVDGVVRTLVERHGAAHEARARRGARQVADRWWTSDGDGEAYAQFCAENFLVDEGELDRTARRLEQALEQVDGHLHEIRREVTTPLELDTGEVRAVDRLLGELDLAAHLDEDLFASKLAFLALLNFPVHTLAERLEQAAGWDRLQWARSRMMDRFDLRVPAAITQGISTAFQRADQYVAEYYIRMDRLVAADGSRPFAENLRLITHWGLRDELKSQYAAPGGLARQRMILDVMRRIVRQEIPQAVIDAADLVWAPGTNEVRRFDAQSAVVGEPVAAEREPDTRYQHLLDVFQAVRRADEYSPSAPTFIDRRFDLDREIPEKQVEQLLVSVLRSRELADATRLVARRLGRPLEPFDIWYDGFTPRAAHSQDDLDRRVAEKYPDVATFQRELPATLRGLGFAPEKAQWLAERIVVDPARGAGHAAGAVRREDKAHLRTHFGEKGMDYKGYNIAIHELGHNVEQVFSLNGIDHWWLAGVPNNAFTEAFAFLFQGRDLELLGLGGAGADSRHLEALDTLWNTAEIGGVALVDMAVWRWMYAHPEASPAELREAALGIARKIWNDYFAALYGVKDSEILAIYSHMIVYGLYLPDYPIGHIIAFQLAGKLRGPEFAPGFERAAKQGRLTPDAWMRGAVAAPISAAALLAEAREALDATER